ncbi:hypothetical protein K8I85_06580 [bacterium]|nr:hypothetical protein [bacterium]
MMEGRRRQWPVRELWIAIIALVAGFLVTEAFAVEAPSSRKMSRQIDVMERIIDQVLIDSPNFLVSGRGNTRGLYIGDYGTVFTFSASLVNKGKNWSFDFGEGFKVLKEGDRNIIVLPDDDVDPDDIDLDEDEDRGLSRTDRQQERLYRRGKAELVDLFLDYGDTMTTLENGEWVAIVAFLRDSSYFADQRISRLLLKAKIDDLRAYAAEKISEEELVKRIVEEEY